MVDSNRVLRAASKFILIIDKRRMSVSRCQSHRLRGKVQRDFAHEKFGNGRRFAVRYGLLTACSHRRAAEQTI